MGTESWFQVLWLQTVLLLRKNLAMQKRNWASSLIQVFIPLVMTFLLFLISVEGKYDPNGYNGRTFELRHADTHAVGAYPSCRTANGFEVAACTHPLAIVFNSSSSSLATVQLVDRVVAELVDAHADIASAAAVPFYPTAEAFNTALLAAPQSVVAAVHFPGDFSAALPEYTVQYNMSRACQFGVNLCSWPWTDVWAPVQVAVERALLQDAATRGPVGNGSRLVLEPSYAIFPHPEMSELQWDIAERAWATTFFFMALMFNFAIQAIASHSKP